MENEGQAQGADDLCAASLGSPANGLHKGNFLADEDPDIEVRSPVSEAPSGAYGYFPASTLTTAQTGGVESDCLSLSEHLAHAQDHAPSTPSLLPLPRLYRNILKCSIAYFIGSLFTFTPYLSGFIADIASYGPGQRGPSPSGHLVATVAVYYNPAKMIGEMIESDVFCLGALVYSATICLSSMTLFWWIDVKPGWEWLADALVILWIGVGMSVVAWTKVWMAKPSFNTACSMSAIILFIVLVKEGGLQILLQVSFIVAVGAAISNIACFLLWPQSALSHLQQNMSKTLSSFSTLLHMLTSAFLLEEPFRRPSHCKLQQAVEDHQTSFTTLKKNLAEAQSEWFYLSGLGGSAAGKKAYEDAVDSLNRLAQHLNGLRSGTRFQYELAKAHSAGKHVLRNRVAVASGAQGHGFPGLDSGRNGNGKGKDPMSEEEDDDTLLKIAATMFGELVDDLGPPLHALSTTCDITLKRMRDAFVPRRGRRKIIQEQEFQDMMDGIQRALFAFESTSNHAVIRLYRTSGSRSHDTPGNSSAENSILTVNEGEHVFLAYFFIFTLQEFASELISLVDATSRIHIAEREQTSQTVWRTPWAVMAALISGNRIFGKTANDEKYLPQGFSRHIPSVFIPHQHRHRVLFPKIRPHAPDTIQTPSRYNLTFIGRVKQSIWALGARLKERDIKYAIKAGMATAILAAPAFIDVTRPTFMEYRGEWALISFFVVISPTIGATNYLSVHRILGTLFGASVATGIYTAFPENPYVLSIFGFFYSLPCFYYIVAKPEYATTGRFVLLTYNLTCLYCYNVRDKNIAVSDIAYHRFVSVTAGVVWAAVVSRMWWPAEARRELSKALGDFCLNIGWLYTRLVAFNSIDPAHEGVVSVHDEDDNWPTEGSQLLSKSASAKLSNSIEEFMSMELHLQIKLIELRGLLAQTVHEPRLKGPFPVELYRKVLTSLQTILDRLHSMRCVTTREEWHTTVRRDFIVPVTKERRELVGNIILALSVLASAFRLKAPLPPYLPPAETSRQRLVAAIRQLDVVRDRDVKGSRQLLFFAYALTMKGVTQELEYLGYTLQGAFGVIGQSREEFEAMFAAQNV